MAEFIKNTDPMSAELIERRMRHLLEEDDRPEWQLWSLPDRRSPHVVVKDSAKHPRGKRMSDEFQKQTTCATLAAAIIGAAGRPFSVQQALDIMNDIYFAMYPMPGNGRFETWAKTNRERLGKIIGPIG